VVDVAPAPRNGSAEPGLRATPLARATAKDLGIDLLTVHGSGPQGRVVERDVLAFAPTAPRSPEPSVAATVPPAPPLPADVEPLRGLRRLTAERVTRSATTVPQVTLLLDVDLTEADQLRQAIGQEYARLGLPRLTWDALFAKALGVVLSRHPAVHAQWVEGAGLRHYQAVHVGIAVALESEGLVVPVVRDADTRSLRALAADVVHLVDRARAGALTPAEMAGGTCTITNLGRTRVRGFTPVLNPPQPIILGIGQIALRPAVRDGALAVRTTATLSVVFDHRVMDGAPAAAFATELVELLERPTVLLGL
jgi:pyruvate dehydrogenase E2 component (dihydrolipoamide acetyltransferase)